ncbi:MAG: hypothetical protein U1D06_12430, partial [Paracoccaceae bacterium]|nr:hypothetical protein [Paracoccaceae bacterium]
LSEPPAALGDFKLGLNIVVAENAQKVPISRDATPDEWKAGLTRSMAERFARYDGDKYYNIGVAVDAFALAPPGIPLVVSPKSVLVITANIWDDAAGKQLNEKGERFTIFEGLAPETMMGSGLTQTKEQQMARLTYNAAKRVERWLAENPEWFGLPPLPEVEPEPQGSNN